MEAHCSAPDLVAGKAWDANVLAGGLHVGISQDSLLTSGDLHNFLERASWDNLDICQLASSPESLFSPKASNRDLALPAAEGGFFAELFPGSLLFPSPNAQPSPSADKAAAAPAAANPTARLPAKIFERLPSEASVAAAGVPTAARNLMGRLDNCDPHGSLDQLQQQPPSPKRRRTSLFHGEAKPPQQAAAAAAMDEEGSDSELGSCWEAPGSSTLALDCGDEADARLENKRARNREAARRLRQRQRQQISRMETEMSAHYVTIQGLLGKLSSLTSGAKCTDKENALLRQLITAAHAQAASLHGGLPACDAGLQAAVPLLPAACLDGSVDPMLFGGLMLPLLPASGERLLVSKHAPAEPLFPDPQPAAAASVAPPASPCGLPAPTFLPPSPFESPRKVLPSPSKPPTPARMALRSPFAAAPRLHSLACTQLLPAPAAFDKALLLEQLSGSGGVLQQGVACALLRGLQEAQERELGGTGLGDEEAVSEDEAVQIAAAALLHAQGNINAAVMQLLCWSGLAQSPAVC